MLGSPYLDQTLDDSDIKRLEDYFEVKDLTLHRHPMSFDFDISFNWPCLGHLPFPFRDVGFHVDYSEHS